MGKARKPRPRLEKLAIEEDSFGSEIGCWNQKKDGTMEPDLRGTFIQGALYARAHYEDLIARGELRIVRKKQE